MSKNTRAIPTVKNENFKKSSENKMTSVKVVVNDPSYCSNFFYFAEISKMSKLEPKNVDFSGIS